MISVNNLKKSYGAHTALEIDELSVPAGKTVAVIGPSGCGKSTLLRLIMHLIRPDSGTVHIAGELMNDFSCRSLRMKIGYVIQEGGLFPHLTCAQNITLMAERIGWAREKIQDRLERLCEIAQLSADQLARYPAQLSGGQRQRVGLMRALLLDPPVLLMDEPLGALDPMIRARLQSDLKEIFAKLRKAILIVTHDMAEAAHLADEIVLLKESRVVQSGTLRKLLNEPADAFVTDFIRAQRPPSELYSNQ